jgi:hypothetical protein
MFVNVGSRTLRKRLNFPPLPYILVTATYTVLISDQIINCKTNAFTVNFSKNICIAGKKYIIKNSNAFGSGNIIIIASLDNQTFDGYSSLLLMPLNAYILYADGANWIIG